MNTLQRGDLIDMAIIGEKSILDKIQRVDFKRRHREMKMKWLRFIFRLTALCIGNAVVLFTRLFFGIDKDEFPSDCFSQIGDFVPLYKKEHEDTTILLRGGS